MANLSGYKSEEVVQLVTDEAQDFDLDEAREQPALGLMNQQAPPVYRLGVLMGMEYHP